MNNETIIAEVKKIFSDVLNIPQEDIGYETNVFKKLGADSLDILELASEIENKFTIEILDKDLTQIYSIKNVIELIYSQKNQKL